MAVAWFCHHHLKYGLYIIWQIVWETIITYIKKIKGPSVEPRGTPLLMFASSDFTIIFSPFLNVVMSVYWILFEK